MSEKKIFVTKVSAEEGEDTVILFPEDLLQYLDLHQGELLVWEVAEDESHIKVIKTKIIDN